MFEEELPEEGEEVATHPQAGVAKKSSQVLVDIPPVAQEMKLSPPPAEPKLGGYISSVLSSMGSRDTGAKPGSRAFRPGMRKSLAAQRSRETRARPDDLSEAKPFMTALFEREEPPPPVREDLQKEERREDKVNGSSVLQQLMEVVTDWADEELNITMYLSLQVYRDKAARFEQWTQDLIVLQSQQFPGYKGTLIYRPDEAHQGSKTYYTYVIDVRYSGAKNLWRWLQSAQRVAVYSTAQAADLWDSSASMSHVHEGIVSAIDDVWNTDLDAEEVLAGKEHQERKPEIAKWRVIFFNTLNVWVSALVLLWPYGSMNRVMFDLGWHWALRQWWIVVLATVEVLWLTVPFTQPYAKWFLLQRRPNFPIFDKEPIRTWYEGFGMCRPKPAAPDAPITENKTIQGFLSKLEKAAAQAKQKLLRKHPSVKGRVPEDDPAAEGGRLPGQYTRAQTMLGVAQNMAEFATIAQMTKEEERQLQRDNTQDFLECADQEVATVLKSTAVAQKDDDAIISIVSGHYVKWEHFSEFEEALNNLGRAAEDFDSKGFMGTTLVRPQPGCNLFTVITRFRGAAALQAWMTSDQRRLMAARLLKYTQSAAEVRVGTHTAVDLLLTGSDQPTMAHATANPPPPKWKVCCIVCVALYICSLPAAFWLVPLMAGVVPTLWAVLVTSTINTYLHGYTLTPLFSLWLKRWLSADRPAIFTKYPWVKNFFLVRWLYDGFNPQELYAVMALCVGMLIGFGFSANIYEEYGPLNGLPADENTAIIGCGMVFPYP